ncbi:MAG: cbb3-type cytochrome c oxidase subunit 3 [Gammaproteobacteria bacterium]|nr:cbb3-type cytochrome c oxidase subunit 3 [Gammaproteobacteria bacterium]
MGTQFYTTLVAMLAFIGVVIWAYGPSRKSDFQKAAEQLFDPAEADLHKASVAEEEKNS